ncbi:hypothetical protein IQ254_12940 [Nodosilinea sp. LEGE 07088]|uniref:alpha-amylase family glycosyl hydrolase n=1 Tax=Nodosilinea sp. LEGE 07088 TaxID=2777968 RepID=UPI001882DC87|nr:alpha-amylase family glycosyl hydrolase [Nodosilinea sp. LEGE 07088]MBE9138081.1 hypothetical protein [Nodosilinea sp. LEGE 07088]
MLDTIGADGFRLDAIQHINGDFFNEWLDHLEAHTGRDLFCVGEYWTYDFGTLSWYIGNAGGRLNPISRGRFIPMSTAGPSSAAVAGRCRCGWKKIRCCLSSKGCQLIRAVGKITRLLTFS